MASKPILIISGPSGVGKGTLINRLFDAHPGKFAFSVSHTTRGPRPGEKPNESYFYVTKQEFEELKAKDGFVESATFGGQYYGTSKMTIEEQIAKGCTVVLDIEMEGVKQVKKSSFGPQTRYVFVAPPSMEELERRLRSRGTETESKIQDRLAQGKVELEFSKTPGVFDKIIVNDDLDAASKELEEFVFEKEPAEA